MPFTPPSNIANAVLYWDSDASQIRTSNSGKGFIGSLGDSVADSAVVDSDQFLFFDWSTQRTKKVTKGEMGITGAPNVIVDHSGVTTGSSVTMLTAWDSLLRNTLGAGCDITTVSGQLTIPAGNYVVQYMVSIGQTDIGSQGGYHSAGLIVKAAGVAGSSLVPVHWANGGWSSGTYFGNSSKLIGTAYISNTASKVLTMVAKSSKSFRTNQGVHGTGATASMLVWKA